MVGMTKPATSKLTINQGATFRKRFTWYGPDQRTAIDLTGCAARMQLREELESPGVLLELTTENGGIALGGLAGTVDLFVSAEATAGMTVGGVYDLEIVHPSGDVTRLVEGSCALRPEVTRA